MKEINITVKYDETQFNAEMITKGFNQSKGPINTFEIIGVLESLQQQEINKLNDEARDG